MPSRVLCDSMQGCECRIPPDNDSDGDVMGSCVNTFAAGSDGNSWEMDATGEFSKHNILTPPRSPQSGEPSEAFLELEVLSRGLKNERQHDCMWSGQCTQNCKKRTVSRPRTKSVSDDGCCNPSAVCDLPIAPLLVSVPTVPCSQSSKNVEHEYFRDNSDNYTHLSDHCYSQSRGERPRDPPVILLSDTPSDSDSEIDIDVVTVQSKLKCIKQEKVNIENSTKLGGIRQCNKRNYKLKRQLECSSSRSSSDSEDTEKRSQHNSMERKRRGDLRSAFQDLREIIPDLKDNHKAPKVLILNSATAFIERLNFKGVKLEARLERVSEKRAELERKLYELKESLS